MAHEDTGTYQGSGHLPGALTGDLDPPLGAGTVLMSPWLGVLRTGALPYAPLPTPCLHTGAARPRCLPYKSKSRTYVLSKPAVLL